MGHVYAVVSAQEHIARCQVRCVALFAGWPKLGSLIGA
jgi:hypothetical protein